ncbi:LLM class flavin-dependent oxidoreductase [Nocardia amamiensis]|uniref:LLM class flavin-dependent oxidoreductase n=1 Tax=Nocardia amamiensis TaxID=404578 RepID=UPI000830DB29|nr:LLM class flavin-dependent oxidoreductase [Nocardia amamiensis]
MRCSINIPNLGDFADPRVVSETAQLAEDAGWDGLFIWDQMIGYNRDLVGEFAATNILLAAAALATQRIRLGTTVTPVPRRRPRQLAREIATLDRLSGGRIILGVGLGNPIDNEYGRFGEPTDPKVLARLLDEGLHAITLLWTGEPVTYHGRHVTIDDVIMLPTPVQRPRVPIWVGGDWPHKPPARRAARWDGAILTTGSWQQPPTADVVAEMHAYIHAHRRAAGLDDQPFELAVGGSTPGTTATARDIVGPLADAGATWWDERFPFEELGKFDAVRARIEQGPPSLG